jgi:SAM-dependent methyltransferase
VRLIATGRQRLGAAWRLLQNPSNLFGWWWWRSPNRPHAQDDSYIRIVRSLPASSTGLDLGSGSGRIRPDAITLDSNPSSGADVIGDGAALPFPDGHFDYVWCNAMLEHVPHPERVAAEIVRTLKPGGLAIVQVPFLENVHSWPEDYFRFTIQGLRVLFRGLEEVKTGVSAGASQVLPDLLQYYATGFAELQQGGLLINLWCIFVGFWLLPIRLLDRVLHRRPSHWKWARAYYFVGRKPQAAASRAA